MPTLDQIRNASERKLNASFKALNKRHRREVLAAVEQYGSVAQIPSTFWQRLQREIEEEEAAALLLLLIAADDWMTTDIRRQGLAATGIGADALTGYGRAAGEQSQRQAGQYMATTRERLVQAESAGELPKKAVRDVLTDERAEAAAVTTTTEGISTGQRGAAERAETEAGGEGAEDRERGQRVNVELVWVTERDDRVCPICRPLDRTNEDTWGREFPNGPPGHVNCRCHLVSRVVVEANLEAA